MPNVNNGLYQNGSAAPGTYEAGTEDYDVLKNRPGTVFRDNTNGAVWKYDGSTFWSYDDPQLVQTEGRVREGQRPGRADDLVARR